MNVATSTRFDVNSRIANIDAISVCFDVMLSVAIKKCEHFDDIDSNIDINVAERIDETIEIDFFMILYVIFDVETRKSKFLTDFRTWCFRIWSWNLLLKLKFCLQRLQIRAQTICWIENFFIDFDANSNVDIWKIARSISIFTRMWVAWARISTMIFAFFANKSDAIFVSFDVILNVVIERCELLNATSCKNIFVIVTKFLDVAEEVDDFCEKNEHVTINFSTNSHIVSNVEFVKIELTTECFWTSIFWNFWTMICSFCETNRVVTFLIVDFFFALHIDLSAWNRKDELIIVLKINVKNVFVKIVSKSCKKMKSDWFANQISTKSQKITFIHSRISNSQYRCWHCWKCWMKLMIWLNRLFSEFWWNRAELKKSKFANKNKSQNVKNSNICFDCIANETKNDELIVDIFIDSHVDLTASIKKCDLTTNFFACCSRLC